MNVTGPMVICPWRQSRRRRPQRRYSLPVALRELWDEPGEEPGRTSRLHVDLSRSREVDDEALPGEERRLPAADLLDLVADAVGERNHMAGVHRVVLPWPEVDLVDRAVAGDEQVARPARFQQEQPLAREEGLRAAPFGVDLDVRG